MSFIRTFFGDIAPDELGVTLAHEHLVCRPPHWIWKDEPDLLLDDPDKTLLDVLDYQAAGGKAIVDATAIDYGRDVEAVAQISRRTGVTMIGTAGFNKSFLWDAPLPPRLTDLIGGYQNFRQWIDTSTVEKLTDFVAAEIEYGLEGTQYRAGQVKFGTGYNTVSPLEIKTIEVAAAVHHRTGAPVHAHTEAGTMALKQIEILKSCQVDPAHCSFGHMDRNLDLWYHRKIAETGAYLSFDGIGKIKYHPEDKLIEHILTLIQDGFGKQLLISGDTARKSYYRHYGHGLGLDYALTGWTPIFRDLAQAAGCDAEVLLKDLFCHNVARCMTFHGKEDADE